MSDDGEGTQVLVLECGSSCVKAGFSEEDEPRCVFPPVLGRDRAIVAMVHSQPASLADLRAPIGYGVVRDWDGLERIWHHTFYNELKISPEKHPVLLLEAPLCPKEQLERKMALLFDTFKFPSISVVSHAWMILASTGRNSGLVVDCGHMSCRVILTKEGFVVPHAIQRLDIGGYHLTQWLAKMLEERGHTFAAPVAIGKVEDDAASYSCYCENPTVRRIKETLAYVSREFESDLKDATKNPQLEVLYGEPLQQTYEGPEDPDKPSETVKVTLDVERFKCPEPLFDPSLLNVQSPGLMELVTKAITLCDVEMQDEMWLGLVVAGGSARFPGMAERMHDEFEKGCIKTKGHLPWKMKVVLPPEASRSAWVGGSIFSCVGKAVFVQKGDYDKVGAAGTVTRLTSM